MSSHVDKDAVKCTDLEGAVKRDGDVMYLLACNAREAYMTATLANNFVPEGSQSLDQFFAIEVTGQFHKAKTSSRTKCSLMI